MNLVYKLIIAFCLTFPSVGFAATLLPNGEQSFTSNNGQPLSSGKVYFYIPGTTTPKNTYQDSGQTILNTNPVVLNAAGRAIIYGSGVYRQVVKDNFGNTIWDQLSTDSSGAFASFGGTSIGSSNAIAVIGTGFSAAVGQSITFISGFTNTGPLTISPDNGTTHYPTVIDTPTGPVPLSGGEVVKGNFVTATFDANGIFHVSPAARTNSVASIPALPITDLGSAGTNVVKITGTASITSLGSTASANSPFYDVFIQNGVTFVNSANLLIPLGNLTASAGDLVRFMYFGNGVWLMDAYFPANGVYPNFDVTNLGATVVNSGTINNSGSINSTGDSHLNTAGALYSGNVTVTDPLYSGINGAVITPPGGAIRAQNVVAARASFSGSAFNTTFNVSNIANGGTGIYNVTFANNVLNNNYNVVAGCNLSSGSALLCPMVSNKSNSGFTLTFFNTSGAATNIGSNISDLIVSGGY